ncbi:MAG: NapC/NirT family cytochrome c [Gammaproteobacteria bacterium]|nr:NapC/NirT family cytochrome c [Gammaproteobacteria bacterium]
MRKILSRISALINKAPLQAAIFFFIFGIIFWGGFNTAMEATNTLKFCISCHEMGDTVYPEYKHSNHYTNASGVQATCPDCHVPKEWLPKVIRKIQASKELFYWIIGEIDSKEKFEAKRLQLAERVWNSMEKTDSRECRNCHLFSVMDLAEQARFAARSHGDAIENAETCIHCHRGIAHHLPAKQAHVTEMVLDREYAEEINETCAGCHGEFGEGTIDGEYPRLAGLDAGYIALQLRHFKSRERLNIPMLPYATERELPEEDVVQIAAYLSQINLPSKLPPIVEDEKFDALARLKESKRVVNIARYPGDFDRGRRFYWKECAGCHGEKAQGNSERWDNSRKIPPLAGQHSIYLLRQINRFRKAERLHDDPRDADIFSSYSDAEIGDMLAYLSVLDD